MLQGASEAPDPMHLVPQRRSESLSVTHRHPLAPSLPPETATSFEQLAPNTSRPTAIPGNACAPASSPPPPFIKPPPARPPAETSSLEERCSTCLKPILSPREEHAASLSAAPSTFDPDTWERVLKDADLHPSIRRPIVHAHRVGVPLWTQPNPSSLPVQRFRNHPLLYLDFNTSKEAIEKEIALGRYVKWSPDSRNPTSLPPRIISPLGVVPKFSSGRRRRAFKRKISKAALKKSLVAMIRDDESGRLRHIPVEHLLEPGELPDKLRIIHDFSMRGQNLNKELEAPYFQMPSAIRFAASLSPGSYIWKSDVQSAFKTVGVFPPHRSLTALYLNGMLFVDARLPLGHRWSPYIFVHLVGKPVLYVCVARGANILGAIDAFVDDFFGGCDTKVEAEAQLELFLRVCEDLGVPISKAKTFVPSQVMELLGYVIDTVAMTITLPQEKLLDIVEELSYLESKAYATKRELYSLAGKMNWAAPVIPGAKTFMRRILNLMNRLKNDWQSAALSDGFRADAAWWRKYAARWNGIAAIPPRVSIQIQFASTDAASQGLGVFLFGTGFSFKFKKQISVAGKDSEVIIAELELIAVALLVAMAAPKLAGRHIVIAVDNTNTCSWIHSGTAKRSRVANALRFLARIRATYSIYITARYVTSAYNVLADTLSRDFDTTETNSFFPHANRWWSNRSDELPEWWERGWTRGSPRLVQIPVGAAGGVLGLLASRLVRGNHKWFPNKETEMARFLREIWDITSGCLRGDFDTLSGLPLVGAEPERPILVQLRQGIHVLPRQPSLQQPAQANELAQSQAYSEGHQEEARREEEEGSPGYETGSPRPLPQRPRIQLPTPGGDYLDDSSGRLLGLPPTGEPPPKDCGDPGGGDIADIPGYLDCPQDLPGPTGQVTGSLHHHLPQQSDSVPREDTHHPPSAAGVYKQSYLPNPGVAEVARYFPETRSHANPLMLLWRRFRAYEEHFCRCSKQM